MSSNGAGAFKSRISETGWMGEIGQSLQKRKNDGRHWPSFLFANLRQNRLLLPNVAHVVYLTYTQVWGRVSLTVQLSLC